MSIDSTDTVYDIGAGSGIITSVLSQYAGTVVAIELETATAKKLAGNMSPYKNVTVVQADFMTLTLPNTPYKVVANIPFHLSSQIIRKLTSPTSFVDTAYLIVQKQFANKLLPNHRGFSSQLGMQIGPWFSIRIIKQLKRTDFWPFPNVDTVLFEIKSLEKPLIPSNKRSAYEDFITTQFTNPNKFHKLTLRNNKLSSAPKASNLTLRDWVALFQTAST